MFKVIKGESPNNFINKYTYISGGSRDGSNCNLYTPKSPNLKNFSYLGAKAWNNLPSDLRNKGSKTLRFSKNSVCILCLKFVLPKDILKYNIYCYN